jgi:hypothetical protein
LIHKDHSHLAEAKKALLLLLPTPAQPGTGINAIKHAVTTLSLRENHLHHARQKQQEQQQQQQQ